MFKVGDTVMARTGGKMLARVNGLPVANKWVEWLPGSIGRIVGVVTKHASPKKAKIKNGIKNGSTLYFVKFRKGIAELRGIYLDRPIDDSEHISRAAMDLADLDIIVKESDIEREPDYYE